MSNWKEYNLESNIKKILDVKHYDDENHHFGRPFLTPYQIAIKFKQRFPKEFKDLELKLGGKGTNKKSSLSQYIANRLSRQIKSGNITDIEGRFLALENSKPFEFLDNNKVIISTLGAKQDMSIFRLVDRKPSVEGDD